MSAFEKVPQPFDPVRIPKNNVRLLSLLFGIALAIGTAALIIIGFLDASYVAPDETEGPAPVRTPATLPGK